MRCPACDHPEDRVIDSRPLESASVIRRRRVCLYCGRRFTTYERVEATPLMVVKRDNRREPFSREKMRAGIDHACRKRPISPAAVEKLVADVEYSLQDFVLEVPSREIGERILKRLHALDPVAYVRFASVYRSYESIDDFQAEMRRLKKNVRRGTFVSGGKPPASPAPRRSTPNRLSAQPLEAQHS
jgi:transcriptional repressor NrdR